MFHADHGRLYRRALLAAALLPGVAQAEVEDALRTPGFVTLDRLDANSRIGTELSIGGGALFRADLHGHYVHPTTGLGLYTTLPLTSDDGPTSAVLGNLELGGMWMTQLGLSTGIVVRAGIVAPTSGRENRRELGISRIADKALLRPEATSVRLSMSPTFRRGHVFGRLDLGADLLADSPAQHGHIFRVQPGLGLIADRVSFMAELVVSHGDTEPYKHRSADVNVALSTRVTTAVAQPFLAIVFPRGDKVAFTVGVDLQL